MAGSGQVSTGKGRSQPMRSFLHFSVRVGELAQKMRRIPALGPGLAHVCSHGPRRATNLVGQRELLFSRPIPAGGENVLLQRKHFLVNPEFSKRTNLFGHRFIFPFLSVAAVLLLTGLGPPSDLWLLPSAYCVSPRVTRRKTSSSPSSSSRRLVSFAPPWTSVSAIRLWSVS